MPFKKEREIKLILQLDSLCVLCSMALYSEPGVIFVWHFGVALAIGYQDLYGREGFLIFPEMENEQCGFL